MEVGFCHVLPCFAFEKGVAFVFDSRVLELED